MDLESYIQPWRQPEVRAAIVMAAAVFVIWRIPVIGWIFFPFYLFAVFVHEFSHGITAMLTGGQFRRVEVRSHESGVAYMHGGSNFLITNAGYVGTALLGGALLILHGSEISSRTVFLGLGIALGVLCLGFVRNLAGIIGGLLLAAGFVLVALRFDRQWSDVLLWLVAIHLFFSTFSILLHMFDRLPVRGAKSDAHDLASVTGVPPAIWVLLWLAIALGILFFALSRAYNLPAPWEISLR